MNTEKIRDLTKVLDAEKAKLAALKAQASMLTLSGHQNQISVTIQDKVQLAVTAMDRGWSQRCIRGREMILLGVKKAMAAMIEEQEFAVEKAKQDLCNAVKGTPC